MHSHISNFIFIENEPEKADIIFVPGASRPQLAERAVELFNQGYASYILPSGGENKKLNGKSEWEFLKDIVVQKGVPENIILKEDWARNTLENAQLSYKALQDQGIEIKKAILVCKNYHARRVLFSYQSVFPDTEFIICPIVDDTKITKDNWFLDEEKKEVVMQEVEKIKKYFGKLLK